MSRSVEHVISSDEHFEIRLTPDGTRVYVQATGHHDVEYCSMPEPIFRDLVERFYRDSDKGEGR